MPKGVKGFAKGNKLGGRKLAPHTIEAARGKALLIKMYMAKVKPINKALIEKAEQGDIQAIRELHDRVWGKAPQDIQLSSEIKLKIDV